MDFAQACSFDLCLQTSMNFIAHYHFYRREDAYYNLGLVLPDLTKNFCKSHLRPKETFMHPQLKALAMGSLEHLKADKIFHQSRFFKQCEELVSHLLDLEANWPRKWFLNHLLSEILIDRVIMERFPKICDEFYNDLKAVSTDQVELFLKMSGIANYQNFTHGFKRFVEIAFIYEYMYNEKIIFALGRVYSRLGIEYTWTEKDKMLLQENIPMILDFIHLELESLESELKQ